AGNGVLLRLLQDREPAIDELVGINNIDYPAVDVPRRARLVKADVCAMAFPEHEFDLVFSLATFEHVHDLQRAVEQIHRVLRPGGLLIAKWSPIWNGFDGHHYGATVKVMQAIELPWVHLIFDRTTLGAYLVDGEGFDRNQARQATEDIYDSDWLNRQSLRAYREAFAHPGFEVQRFDGIQCNFRPLMARVAAAVDRGFVPRWRVAEFFRRARPEEILTYKLIVHLRRPEERPRAQDARPVPTVKE
ncbi:MAG: class I SAM-dependent methyltransferase, partial [Planctomycetes bacterium]|nr:class I SAM-dependent methyltransferase [Planctomycetota bacterium]